VSKSPHSHNGLLAFGTAVSVAAIYLSQPILNLLAAVLHASVREMGLVITVTQLGFGAGIVFLVPLGDVIAKKTLILGKLVLVSGALVAAGLASSVGQMAAAGLAIGLFASAAQDFVPLAAELSAPERRGRSIGTVMAGLFLGILGSRVFSGVLAENLGWRAPFLAVSVLALVVAALVWRKIPSLPQDHASSYPALLRSMVTLVAREPLLVLSTVAHGCVGLAFSAFWSLLSFQLGSGRFHLSPSLIGCFALAGFAGAAFAPVAGRLADRHGPLFNIRAALVLLTLSFASMLVLPGSLAALAVATVTFDLGAQVSMVSHQTVIYSLEPRARSRINAVYVGGLFGFFALGSFVASWAFSRHGWAGVVVLCLAGCGGSALAHLALSRKWAQRRAGC
jgi:predicted MFS family arabinose efflux permease